LDGEQPEIQLVKKINSRFSYESIDIKTLKNTINMEDLEKNSNVSSIELSSDEGPDFKYLTTGRKIKINITSDDFDDPDIQEQILKETIKILKNL